MSVDSNLKTLTLQNPAVVALIGNRYFIDHIPEVSGGMVYPCVRSVTVSDPPANTHAGSIGGNALIQLDVYDDDQINCNAAADALFAWLNNYHGGMGSYNVTIQVKNKPSGWETDSRLFHRMIEVEILYLNGY